MSCVATQVQLWLAGGHQERSIYLQLVAVKTECYSGMYVLRSVVWSPSEDNILIYEIQTGEKVKALLGHYNCVNSCIFHPFYHESYRGGNDKNFLIWTAEKVPQAAYSKHSQSRIQTTGLFQRMPLVTADNWGSDKGWWRFIQTCMKGNISAFS